MLNQKLIDSEYGFLGKQLYFNFCTAGPLPLRAQKVSDQFAQEYTKAVLSGHISYDSSRDHCRKLLAQLIGCRADEIALTHSTTEGMSILASGFPLGPGDSVITCDIENPAGIYPWLNASKVRGFEVRMIKTQNGRLTCEDIVKHMDHTTKVVAVSLVQAGTGYLTDAARIGEECRKRGIVFAVDAIQALGRLHVNVQELGIDYLTCGGYKGLLAGFGVGFMFCRQDLNCQIVPPYAGMQNSTYMAPYPNALDSPDLFELRKDGQRFEAGSDNTYGIRVMENSLSFLMELGPREIDQHIRRLERRLRERLDLSELKLFGRGEPECWSGIVAMQYPEHRYEKARQIFDEENICLTHRPGYIRLAINFNHTDEQIDTLADALLRI